jgi:hypothetical protein
VWEVLQPIAPDVWVDARPLRFFGIETGTRMTVVRLAGGELVIHSPVQLDADTRAEIDRLGDVRAILAPSLFHHLSVGQWIEAYPEAKALACDGLQRKRADLPWAGVLGDDPDAIWAGQLQQVHFSARTLENEVVFYHPGSRTMVCADAVFNLGSHPSALTRCVAWALGNRRPGATLLERIMIRRREAAREQVDRMLAWPFERIVLAHGDIVEHGAKQVLARAYAWL